MLRQQWRNINRPQSARRQWSAKQEEVLGAVEALRSQEEEAGVAGWLEARKRDWDLRLLEGELAEAEADAKQAADLPRPRPDLASSRPELALSSP